LYVAQDKIFVEIFVLEGRQRDAGDNILQHSAEEYKDQIFNAECG
jgi:hypothetical protein